MKMEEIESCIHPETDKLIHHLLQYLANNGLDKTVDYIVKEIKE